MQGDTGRTNEVAKRVMMDDKTGEGAGPETFQFLVFHCILYSIHSVGIPLLRSVQNTLNPRAATA